MSRERLFAAAIALADSGGLQVVTMRRLAAELGVEAAGVYLHYEAVLAALVAGGFSYHLAHRALHALGSMVLGFVQEPFSPAPAAGGADVDPSQEQPAELADALPHLAAMMAAEFHAPDDQTLGWCDSRAECEFTLDLRLDGLAGWRG